MDHVFIERLWRSVKYEDIYLKNYSSAAELRQGLNHYFHCYNDERIHQSLDNFTPTEVYGEVIKKVA
jgi:putative transposase